MHFPTYFSPKINEYLSFQSIYKLALKSNYCMHRNITNTLGIFRQSISIIDIHINKNSNSNKFKIIFNNRINLKNLQKNDRRKHLH